MSESFLKIKRGQLISWKSHNKRECGIVLDRFTYSYFDQMEREGIFVLTQGKIYKIYNPEDIKIIRDIESLNHE